MKQIKEKKPDHRTKAVPLLDRADEIVYASNIGEEYSHGSRTFETNRDYDQLRGLYSESKARGYSLKR